MLDSVFNCLDFLKQILTYDGFFCFSLASPASSLLPILLFRIRQTKYIRSLKPLLPDSFPFCLSHVVLSPSSSRCYERRRWGQAGRQWRAPPSSSSSPSSPSLPFNTEAVTGRVRQRRPIPSWAAAAACTSTEKLYTGGGILFLQAVSIIERL